MYRIMIASNGYYYVQHHTGWNWRKVGGFFNTRAGARQMVRDDKRYKQPRGPYFGKVVEYV